jgi:DNA-binding response OmpR family regulator
VTRILVVEDHADLAFGLETALENEGFGVEVAADGSTGLDRAWAGGFDLIILDLMLPRLTGTACFARSGATGARFRFWC